MEKTCECRRNHSFGVSGEELEDVLGQAWEGLLTAVADQDKPDHSLAIALRQKASLLQDLLSGLETGPAAWLRQREEYLLCLLAYP